MKWRRGIRIGVAAPKMSASARRHAAEIVRGGMVPPGSPPPPPRNHDTPPPPPPPPFYMQPDRGGREDPSPALERLAGAVSRYRFGSSTSLAEVFDAACAVLAEQGLRPFDPKVAHMAADAELRRLQTPLERLAEAVEAWEDDGFEEPLMKACAMADAARAVLAEREADQ